MKTSTNYMYSSLGVFKSYKELGEKALAQVSDDQLFISPGPESNSLYIIIKHLSGNMLSRWTDFLTTDGEKEWRHRDKEFEEDILRRNEVMEVWERGWKCVFDTLTSLTENDISKIVKIRGEEHSVMEAINRQVAHYSYHIGQMVYLARMLKGDGWNSLSIPKNKSDEFNSKMMK